jgi:hypothetical protein
MSECKECGAAVAPNENFCGNCGTQNPPVSSDLKTVAASLEQIEIIKQIEMSKPADGDKRSESNRLEEIDIPTEETPIDQVPVKEPEPVVSAPVSEVKVMTDHRSDVGSSTGDVPAKSTSVQPKKGTTGGRHTSVKQLEPGIVLNGRYEIVRRIGGGGMGAVYLAKDRNLGDAPRAVKEMVESHLDPTQHEKAIGDFKRESLLLTSLEHPSIPTIYDYFYDESSGRVF